MRQVIASFGLILLIFGAFTVWAIEPTGQISCWPVETSANIHFTLRQGVELPLFSNSSQGRFKTYAQLVLNQEKNGIRIQGRFSKDSPPYGNEFNVYAIMVLNKGSVIYFNDYTEGCNSPGVGFYPEQKADLGLIKTQLPQNPELQVIVWGRL